MDLVSHVVESADLAEFAQSEDKHCAKEELLALEKPDLAELALHRGAELDEMAETAERRGCQCAGMVGIVRCLCDWDNAPFFRQNRKHLFEMRRKETKSIGNFYARSCYR